MGPDSTKAAGAEGGDKGPLQGSMQRSGEGK